MNTKEDLLKRLKEETRVLENPLIEKAFQNIDRADFVFGDYEVEAYEDYTLPTISGQTISQPTTVAFMLELLNPQSGEKVLDVGSGTGWTTALLAHIVGKDGYVYGVDTLPELVEAGQKNLKKYSSLQAEITQAGTGFGLPQDFLYDRILVNASTHDIPSELLVQLRIGGIMVIPVGESLVRVVKKSETENEEKQYSGFAFTPLLKEN